MEVDKKKQTTTPQKAIPDCLGEIHKKHSRKCDSECSKSALCVLMVMGKYLSKR